MTVTIVAACTLLRQCAAWQSSYADTAMAAIRSRRRVDIAGLTSSCGGGADRTRPSQWQARLIDRTAAGVRWQPHRWEQKDERGGPHLPVNSQGAYSGKR